MVFTNKTVGIIGLGNTFSTSAIVFLVIAVALLFFTIRFYWHHGKIDDHPNEIQEKLFKIDHNLDVDLKNR